jgi:hypothetical protein
LVGQLTALPTWLHVVELATVHPPQTVCTVEVVDEDDVDVEEVDEEVVLEDVEVLVLDDELVDDDVAAMVVAVVDVVALTHGELVPRLDASGHRPEAHDLPG